MNALGTAAPLTVRRQEPTCHGSRTYAHLDGFCFLLTSPVVAVRASLSRMAGFPVVLGGESDVQCGPPDGPQRRRRHPVLGARLQGLQQLRRLLELLVFLLMWRLELWRLVLLLELQAPQEQGLPWRNAQPQAQQGLPQQLP